MDNAPGPSPRVRHAVSTGDVLVVTRDTQSTSSSEDRDVVIGVEKYVHFHEERKICIPLSPLTTEKGCTGDTFLEKICLTIVSPETWRCCPELSFYTGDPVNERHLSVRPRQVACRSNEWLLETRIDAAYDGGSVIVRELHPTAIVQDIVFTTRKDTASKSGEAEWNPIKNWHAAGGGRYFCVHRDNAEKEIRFEFSAARGRGDLRHIYLTWSSAALDEAEFRREEMFVEDGGIRCVVHMTGRSQIEIDGAEMGVFKVGAGEFVVRLEFDCIDCIDAVCIDCIRIIPNGRERRGRRKTRPLATLASVSVEFYRGEGDSLSLLPLPRPPQEASVLQQQQQQQQQQQRERPHYQLYDLKKDSTCPDLSRTFYRAPNGTVVFSTVPTNARTSLSGLFDGSGCKFCVPGDTSVEIVIAFARPVRIAAVEMTAGKGTNVCEIRLGSSQTKSAPVIVHTASSTPVLKKARGKRAVSSVCYDLAIGADECDASSEVSVLLKRGESGQTESSPLSASKRWWFCAPGISFYTAVVDATAT